ncbi:signal recognition particle receptor subunit beta [Hetaerina americana]|uniref:signal recognition particle receptor subunit beta n=1 Tax=Hetaerina americana TaxID=62018 RepID=UPI003A7F49AB
MAETGRKGLDPNDNILSSMKEDEQLIAIIVGIIVILITLGIFVLWRKKKHSRRSVLLMGLCDSGKTLIFSRILENMYVMTHTSMKENVGEFVSKKGSLKVVDIPGHERIRNKFFDQHKTSARGIIYVIDSVTIQKELRDVAEFLYNLLTDPMVNSHCVPLAIVCNKQDQTIAKGSTVIRNLLEKEMNMLRVTKSNQLQSTVEASNNNTFLGKQGKDFNFDHLYPIKVEFFESTALNKNPDNPPDVDSITSWLHKVA